MRTRTALLIVAIAASVVAILRAQTPPRFEVASIKPNKSGGGAADFGVQPGGRLTATNMRLDHLIAMAYSMRLDQLVGGPSWIGADRFDIEARADGELTSDVTPLALRQLLADRFKLKAHQESRDVPVFALVVARADGKPGPKLHPTADHCAEEAAARQNGQPSAASQPMRCGFAGGAGALTGLSESMSALAARLIARVDRPVVDRTGLSGTFDFDLTWSPAQSAGTGVSTGVSIFTALQEQLGLKLQPASAPGEFLVIDHIEHPTEN